MKAIRIVMIAALSLLLLVPGSAASQEQATVWKEFSEWARKVPDYGDLQSRYRNKLLGDGRTEYEADETIAAIRAYAKDHREDVIALHFNKMYTIDQNGAFTTEANAYLVSVTEKLKPGAALDVSMGQGRNGLYLASQGWEVTGFDIAEEGLAVAKDAAAEAGVCINAVHASLEGFDFGKERWDLVFFIYAFAPLSDTTLVERVWESLRPGGHVLIEHPMGEPDKPWEEHDKLNAIPKAWGEKFRIMQYQDVQDMADWHQYGITKNREDPLRVVRFLARK